jgi:hypothetical protein
MTADRRALPRFKVRIPAKLMWATGAKDCVITDLSESGARVDMAEFTSLPDKVDLFESKGGNIFECLVRWQAAAVIGLQFVDFCSRTKRRALIEQYALGRLKRPARRDLAGRRPEPAVDP